MCKLLGTSKILARRHSHIVELTRYSAKALGSTQKDGFGFALKHQKGVYVEKYLSPDTCKGMGILPSDIKKIPGSLPIAIRENRDFACSGPYPESEFVQGCYISHGRTATCDKVISNTHPFQGKDGNDGLWTIAHNGVVDLIGENIGCKTTCDSEHILNCFTSLNGVHSLKSQISGYAAILGINPNGEMIAFRDETAPLYVSMIEGLGVFTLSTDPKHCEEFNELVCKQNRIKKSKITDSYLIEAYNFLTFHQNGEITNVVFEPFARYSSNYQAVKTSLGSAGVSNYGAYGSSSYPSNYGHSKYRDSGYNRHLLDDDDLEYLAETESSAIARQTNLPGLSETERFAEDPALLEAIDKGELTVRDLADIAGESDATEEAIEHLENKIANKLKKSGKSKTQDKPDNK